MCLQPNTIASEPVRGWIGKPKPHSHAALEWLNFKNQCLHQQTSSEEWERISHTGNRGEQQIRLGNKRLFVDVFDVVTKKIYEFLGCFYHGCPKCFPNRDERYHKPDNHSMREVYENTFEKILTLEQAGYDVEFIWGCDWSSMKKADPEIQRFVDSLQLTSHLDPREGFYGGRTSATKLYHKISDGEEIRYVDFTSLYPFENKTTKNIVGHPLIITKPDVTDLHEYFGLIKCTVIPPFRLDFAVLPYRSGGKLTFPLCLTCLETQMCQPMALRSFHCPHTHRVLTGTWCTPEVLKAVEKGYEIESIHEVWHFPNQCGRPFQEIC